MYGTAAINASTTPTSASTWPTRCIGTPMPLREPLRCGLAAVLHADVREGGGDRTDQAALERAEAVLALEEQREVGDERDEAGAEEDGGDVRAAQRADAPQRAARLAETRRQGRLGDVAAAGVGRATDGILQLRGDERDDQDRNEQDEERGPPTNQQRRPTPAKAGPRTAAT